MSFFTNLLKWKVPRLNAAGTALVGPDGNIPLTDYSNSTAIEIMPTDDLTMWNTDITAGLTVEVDETVLFMGRPSLKITIPAGTSGTCKVGTNVANARIPYLWNKENYCLVVKYGGFTGYTYSGSSYPPSLVMYFGNAAYGAFWSFNGFNGANYPEYLQREDDWLVFKPDESAWGNGGDALLTTGGLGVTISEANLRCKLQWTQVSQATDCYIWIGLFGKMPDRPKPTLIWSLDDGYSEWYSFIKPLFEHYDMPVTMAISSDLVGNSGFLTQAQIAEMFNHQSRLFDFVNHSTNNSPISTLGTAAYAANVATCRAYLEGIGITGDGPRHHPWVQSAYTNDGIDALSAAGMLSARRGSSASIIPMYGRDGVLAEDKAKWLLEITKSLGSAVSLAQAKTAVDAIVSNNIVGFINGHQFGTTADTYKWTYSDMQQLVGYVAALRDAGSLEVKSWTKWYADKIGRVTDRR